MNQQQLKQALFGHQLLMTNISILHLLIPIIAFSSGYIKEILLFSLIVSLLFATVIAKGAKSHDKTDFVSAHWKMAWKRSRYLLVSYVVSASVMGLGWLLTSSQTDPQMQKILMTTFIPMAVVPTLVTVIVIIVLQTMTISRAKQGLAPINKL